MPKILLTTTKQFDFHKHSNKSHLPASPLDSKYSFINLLHCQSIVHLGNLPSRPDKQLSSTWIHLGILFIEVDSRGREGGHELQIPRILCCHESFTCWSILGVCSTWLWSYGRDCKLIIALRSNASYSVSLNTPMSSRASTWLVDGFLVGERVDVGT